MLVRHAWVAFSILLSTLASGNLQAEAGVRQEVSLNGIWDFFPNGEQDRRQIRVPSFWDAPQDYGYPTEWLHMKHGIYRREVTVPSSMEGKEIFLRIKRVSVLARVFLNGQQVGGETSGGFLMMQLPYLINITRQVRIGGANQLEVRVWGGQSLIHGIDEGLKDQIDFPADAFEDGKLLYPWCVDHYDGRRGINGDVALVTYPKLRISDVWVTPALQKNRDPGDDRVRIAVTVKNSGSEPRTVSVQNQADPVKGRKGGKPFEAQSVTIQPGSEEKVVIEAPWNNAHYWWPHDPFLYLLKTTLLEGSAVVDRAETRFGFREFGVDGNHYRLNGIKANLRGDAFEFTWHDGYRHGPSTAPVLSTKELVIATQRILLDEYKKLNLNMLRPHKACGIDELYDRCDELGLLVFDEAPFWQTQQRTDARSRANFQDWVARWVRDRRNHPSIVAWIIANESWSSPIPAFTIEAARSGDFSRPVFHQGVRPGDLEGDAQVVHYTGGYPMGVFNTPDLYSVYSPNPAKPKGEGEALFAEGWPLKNADGTLSGKRSDRGDFANPDMVSQGEWLRGCARLVRAMRFAELADSRLYAAWVYAFEPIEADLRLDWPDLASPGIKPTLLHRPICDPHDPRRAGVQYSDGYNYYVDSHSPVAVFDLDWDRENLLGIEPTEYPADALVNRTLVVYNDEFSNGETIRVGWEAGLLDPRSDRFTSFASGSTSVDVPYGEKRTVPLQLVLPRKVGSPHWLLLKLTGSKEGKLKFEETNRIGVMGGIPPARLAASNQVIELGSISGDASGHWHKVRLVNQGGELSEKWCAEGLDQVVKLNRATGNLRGEEEVYFQVNPAGLPKDKPLSRTITFVGEHGSRDSVTIKFTPE